MSRWLFVCALIAASLPSAGCGRGEKSRNPAGTLEATELDLAPLLAGRVERVGAREGDLVAAGDTLLVINTDLLRLSRDEATAALAAVTAQREVAAAKREQAAQSHALAGVTLRRVSAMLADGNATQQRLDEAQTQRDLAASRLRETEQSIAALAAERDRLAVQIARIDRQLEDGSLLSPTAGTVLARLVEPGEVTQVGGIAVRIADLTHLELRIYLSETELGRVRIGQRLPIRVDAAPQDPREGTVSWISAEAEFTPKNAQTRQTRAQLVYAVKLRVENPDGRLHIGMPAEVVF